MTGIYNKLSKIDSMCNEMKQLIEVITASYIEEYDQFILPAKLAGYLELDTGKKEYYLISFAELTQTLMKVIEKINLETAELRKSVQSVNRLYADHAPGEYEYALRYLRELVSMSKELDSLYERIYDNYYCFREELYNFVQEYPDYDLLMPDELDADTDNCTDGRMYIKTVELLEGMSEKYLNLLSYGEYLQQDLDNARQDYNQLNDVYDVLCRYFTEDGFNIDGYFETVGQQILYGLGKYTDSGTVVEQLRSLIRNMIEKYKQDTWHRLRVEEQLYAAIQCQQEERQYKSMDMRRKAEVTNMQAEAYLNYVGARLIISLEELLNVFHYTRNMCDHKMAVQRRRCRRINNSEAL